PAVVRATLFADALDIATRGELLQRVGSQAAALAPGTNRWPHVSPECGTEQLLRLHEPASVLQLSELVEINECSPRVQLLRSDNALHHGLHLALQVVALIDHERDRVGLRARAEDLSEDAEELIGIDGSERQVVVRVLAIVEVEAPQLIGVQQPRDDLLNVRSLV